MAASFKSTLVKILIGVVFLLAVSGLYVYLGNFSTGTRAGVVMKISKKGYVFKTHEGQLDVGQINQPWDFSVDGGDQELIEILERVQTTGERVKLFYVEKFIQVPWRGDTKYFITSIEVAAPQKNEQGSHLPCPFFIFFPVS